jgi:imidazolonepropionase-like amidohydrolase
MNQPDRSQTILFRDAALLDPEAGELHRARSVLTRDGVVAEVGGPEIRALDARVVDLRGRTLMPGLIDAHVHVNAFTADIAAIEESSPAYVTARASRLLHDMLHRGFTTVRDVAGADYGIAAAVEEGWLEGPQIVHGGKALSQTGGHGDHRPRGRNTHDPCHCLPTLSRICDGVDQVRAASRDEIRRGARHIKLMLSGGVASPTDRIESVQFSRDEIRAAVEEAKAAGIYVTGHAYTAGAVTRALECGIRCIEHGNLMDERSVELLVQNDAFYVPTLATYSALAERGRDSGLPEESYRKLAAVLDGGRHALEVAHRAGATIVYGTDLLGAMQDGQLSEFSLRSEVQPAAAILRAATITAARLLGQQGRLGVISPGARADMLVVDGNPLEDIRVLTRPESCLLMVVQGGRVVRELPSLAA